MTPSLWRSLIYLVICATLTVHLLLFFWHAPRSPVESESLGARIADHQFVHVNESLVTLIETLQKVKSRTKDLISRHEKVTFQSSERGESQTVTSTTAKEEKDSVYRKKALIFTMDSIESYEANSLTGGAAGEILIRKSLERAFTEHLNVEVHVCKSDEEFERTDTTHYDILILDPWTWAAAGWVPKKPIRGQEHKLYLLDFFGSVKLKGQLDIPLDRRLLTAFGSPWNTFLGYFIDNNTTTAIASTGTATRSKKAQGVVWGKDPKHYHGKENMLKSVANRAPLLSSATAPVFQHPNLQWLGHQSADSWRNLLVESKFLLGMGHPLLGPSAIDAVVAGAVFINPQYSVPVKGYTSQHPYAETRIGHPYVCSYSENDMSQLQKCIEYALSADLPPFVPDDFLLENYLVRVKRIFDL